ncbi:MAG TPA: hypothetical protein VIR34_07840 [Gemmatimonadaceae bacterium]|jgi:hypothetical protein
MRITIPLLALLFASALPAQEPATAPRQQATSTPATTSASADPIAVWLDSLAKDAHGLVLARAAVREGNQRVAEGDTISGNIATWHGTLDVAGHIDGNAVAVGGDVVIHPGAVIGGDALAVGGKVRNEGGIVDGEMRSLSALTVGPLPTTPPRSAEQTARRSVSLAVGWYLVLAAIGLAVVLFARGNLETISDRIRSDFTRSFLYGLAGQLLLVPALLISIVALAITVIGIILIPFAIVGFCLAVAGGLALGFIAMSYVMGDAAMRWRGAAVGGGRAQLLQFLLMGLSIYLVLWVIGGAVGGFGALGGLVRFIVTVLTWVALTVGFGATLASRGGTRARLSAELEEPEPADELSWQTPTPVSGVAAARRPSPVEREGR